MAILEGNMEKVYNHFMTAINYFNHISLIPGSVALGSK